MKVFQAGVEYIKMTIIREWPKAWSGGGGLPSAPDAACLRAALHLEEGRSAWVPIVTTDSAVFLQNHSLGA